jgi:hypothetical protein
MTIGKISPPPTELNFNVVWNQLPQNVKQAFIGVPQKVKLRPRFMLYRFTEFFIANREGKITEWWSPVHPYGIDPGLSARIHLAKHLGASPADLARVVAAVKENWNALTHVLQAQLLMAVYGFWGQCATQSRRDQGQQARAGIAAPPARGDMQVVRTTNLPGYARQFYIPNLTSAHIREVSPLPI